MDLAVLSLVTLSLDKVVYRWSELVDFFRTLLEGDNSLLDPIRHDHLLFDNENFSKSREYFWAINCLTEFEASVSANIEHWEEYRRYLESLPYLNQELTGAEPLLEENSLISLLDRSNGYCARLRRYQRFFQEKRAATIALRDGVKPALPCL